MNPQFIGPEKEELETIEGWSTDIITDLTISFLKNRDKSKPFLALCQYKATHDPWDSREPYKFMWMPFIIRYPKWFAQGSENDDMISNVDFAPTLLDLAGIPIPGFMQGESFKNNLQGKTKPGWQDAVYYHYWQHILHRDVAAHFGLRTKDKKLIFYYGLPLAQTEYEATEPEWKMFDLAKDANEMNNVYNNPDYAQNVKRLKQKLLDYLKKYDDTDERYPELKRVKKSYW